MPGARDSDGLTKKERQFVAAYLQTFSPSKAARAIGLDRSNGWAYHRRPPVAAEIRRQTAELVEQQKASAANVIRLAMLRASFDPRSLLNPDGTPRLLVELDEDDAQCVDVEINEVYIGAKLDKDGNVVEEGRVEKLVRMHSADKDKSLKLLAQALKLLESDLGTEKNPLVMRLSAADADL